MVVSEDTGGGTEGGVEIFFESEDEGGGVEGWAVFLEDSS